MALDPNIALGVRGIEIANPLAQYGQITQIQNAQNQNAMAQYQLESAKREQESVNALNQAYAKAYDPKTGQIDANALRQSLAGGGFGSKLPAVEKGLLELGKLKTETQKAETELIDSKLKQSRQFLDTINPIDPRAPEQYLAWHQANHADPILGPALAARGVTAEQSLARIQQAIKAGPQAFADLINQSKLGTEKFMELNKPQYITQDLGGKSQVSALPGLGGAPTVISTTAKTATIADQLAREKFNWEKANPGYELKEAEDGSIVGVNKRTLQAFPVSIGGAAPASQPMPMAGAGMPGARMPAATTVPAILGMTSVLDQQAPAAAPVAGTPLRGKGQNMTESQGAAAAYGMRMKEANSILAPLEKSGVKNTGLISGTVGGVVGLVPLIGDKLESATGSVFNSLPQILGGLSPEQQQVAQARINFITAVLRKESGASISPAEFSTAEKNYFPKPGDDASTIAQKQKARETAIKAMEIQAGPGAKYIQQHQANVGGGISNATANDPLGLGIR
jgi:hypothetical protein